MSISTEMRSRLDKICGGRISYDVPMRRHTSFKIGGPADAVAEPASAEEIIRLLEACSSSGTPYYIIGNGSNLLISDKGLRGVVIKCAKNFSRADVRSNIIEAESGVMLSRLAFLAAEKGLSGMEFAGGIPGTLGGALYMNAGAYDGEMSGIVQSTTYINSEGKIAAIRNGEHKFAYRSSAFAHMDCVILSCVIALKNGDSEQIRRKMEDFNKSRREKQPLDMPSCGSTFKRPPGHYAGALIQDCGLMGYSSGGAAVSSKHAGFVVNTGGASAEDVRRVIEHVQNEVSRKHGIFLECEVKMLGF